MMHYRYTHTTTEATTGYFSCEPSPALSVEDALRFLAGRPLDDFMRRHVLLQLSSLSAREISEKLLNAFPGADFPPPILALLRELAVLHPPLAEEHPLFAACFKDTDVSNDTSLIFLRWRLLPDRETHRQWGAVFAQNRHQHRALPAPREHGLPALYPLEADSADGLDPQTENDRNTTASHCHPLPGGLPLFDAPFPLPVARLFAQHTETAGVSRSGNRPDAGETAALAEECLSALGIIAGREMRHTASLSPVALLRPWTIRLSVDLRRHRFSLQGQATTYGRGLCIDDARASCLMEMVERASAYLSVTENGVENRVGPCPLVYGGRSHIQQHHGPALDPNEYPLEAPYTDAPLYWMAGSRAEAENDAPFFVPVQMAGLFCNLDEISLFDSPGSTGLAAGCGREEAKLAALLEILERDAVATTPFSRDQCFTLEADAAVDPLPHALLQDYKARGINIQFQDITGPMGVPAYTCFVMGTKGTIAAGHGCGLSGRKALLSALTETPFPYPDGGPSGPLLRKLPVRKLHELPDYSLPTAAANLALLESLLRGNGRTPAYVDLTHADLRFPVVRAFIPGLELTADSDAFTRVPVRLYRAYQRLFAAQ